jgi:hypothetical protein
VLRLAGGAAVYSAAEALDAVWEYASATETIGPDPDPRFRDAFAPHTVPRYAYRTYDCVPVSEGPEFSDLDVAVGQSVAQVPPHRHHDHLGREPEPGERRSRRQPRGRTIRVLHGSSLRRSCSPPTQRPRPGRLGSFTAQACRDLANAQRNGPCGARKPGSGYAACLYSLIKPPRIGRRSIFTARDLLLVGAGWVAAGPGPGAGGGRCNASCIRSGRCSDVVGRG